MFVGFEVGEFEIGPESWRRSPSVPDPPTDATKQQIKVVYDLRGDARDDRLVAPRAEAMVVLHGQHITPSIGSGHACRHGAAPA